MIRVQSSVPPVSKRSTVIKIIERSWGIERCYLTPDGETVCIPAPFLTNYRYLDWTCFVKKSI